MKNFHIVRNNFIIGIGLILILVGCQDIQQSQTGAVPRTSTIVLPASASTVAPTPVNTRVMPVDVLTPPPTRTITPIPDETYGLIVEVLDGDTVAVVMDGDPAKQAYQVRYLGVDAPDLNSPWGVVAYERNRQLINLKVVRLIRDGEDFDAEGYLLRHIYIDNQLISTTLAEQGLVEIDEGNDVSPRFGAEISAAIGRAERGQLGLWGPDLPTPTVIVSDNDSSNNPQETATLSPTITTTVSSATATTVLTATPTLSPTISSTVTVESTSEPDEVATPTPNLQGP